MNHWLTENVLNPLQKFDTWLYCNTVAVKYSQHHGITIYSFSDSARVWHTGIISGNSDPIKLIHQIRHQIYYPNPNFHYNGQIILFEDYGNNFRQVATDINNIKPTAVFFSGHESQRLLLINTTKVNVPIFKSYGHEINKIDGYYNNGEKLYRFNHDQLRVTINFETMLATKYLMFDVVYTHVADSELPNKYIEVAEFSFLQKATKRIFTASTIKITAKNRKFRINSLKYDKKYDPFIDKLLTYFDAYYIRNHRHSHYGEIQDLTMSPYLKQNKITDMFWIIMMRRGKLKNNN